MCFRVGSSAGLQLEVYLCLFAAVAAQRHAGMLSLLPDNSSLLCVGGSSSLSLMGCYGGERFLPSVVLRILAPVF